MIQIINGKKYNTETAKKVGYYSSPGVWGDFDHYEETLYQKKTGEFFLYGEGGPRTGYSKIVGQNSWSGGYAIIPKTFNEAREWAEEHLSAEEYESIFGEVPEDDSKTVIALNLTASSVERLKRAAAIQSKSMSGLVEDLIATLKV